jgi:hypothetical protein
MSSTPCCAARTRWPGPGTLDQINPRDILWVAHGIAQAADGPGGEARVERLLSVLRGGLAAGGSAR